MTSEEKLKLHRFLDDLRKVEYELVKINGTHLTASHQTVQLLKNSFLDIFKDELSTESLVETTPRQARALYAVYGNKNPKQCPICSSEMIKRKVKSRGTEFLGCSKFPSCRGSRHSDGTPTFTPELRLHLQKLAQNDTSQLPKKGQNRFADIE